MMYVQFPYDLELSKNLLYAKHYYTNENIENSSDILHTGCPENSALLIKILVGILLKHLLKEVLFSGHPV